VKRIALAAVVPVCLAACSSGVVKIKDPGPVPETTSTTAIDFGAIGLKGVTSRTTTSVPMGPGGATLNGTVAGPAGAVEGATVRVERLAGGGVASMDLTSAADGTWTLPMVLGGRFRVRAWKAPDMAQTKPEIFYLQSSETRTVNLRMDAQAGGAATPSIAPNPPITGEQANLYVLLSRKTVDPGGYVKATPVSGAAVELAGSGVQLESSAQSVTDGNGVAQWRLRCTTAGKPSLSLIVSGAGTFPLDVPACVEPGTPPSTVETTSTTSPSRRSTTTRRGA
jgi:hypothetical protein